MRLLQKILWWPFARRKVDDGLFADFAGILEATLAQRGLKGIVSQPLLDRLVQEAYARAGAEESDRIPRYAAMCNQLEAVAEGVALLFAGTEPGDPALDVILVHYGVRRPSHRA